MLSVKKPDFIGTIFIIAFLVAAMASGDRKVEKELARREYRTELEGESRGFAIAG